MKPLEQSNIHPCPHRTIFVQNLHKDVQHFICNWSSMIQRKKEESPSNNVGDYNIRI